MGWFTKKKNPESHAEPDAVNALNKKGFFSEDSLGYKEPFRFNSFSLVQPNIKEGFATDSLNSSRMTGLKTAFNLQNIRIPEELLNFYTSQTFIGHQACALLSQQWLINKACTVPAKDAIKKGYDLSVNDGDELAPEVISYIAETDKKYKITKNLVEFEKFKRVFGIRIAMFVVESDDKDYYAKPFNIDGVKPGSYKGITQIDPYWVTPELDFDSVGDPSAIDFYEPTFWTIGGMKVHKSHLSLTRYSEVSDILKPTYFYGGLPLPQLIYERVYSAERTANETPLLAMTKRLNILQIDLESAVTNVTSFFNRLAQWAKIRDNHGAMVIGEGEVVSQIDTNLAGVDDITMTQYQIVAGIANVPVTKLMGTTPKGFQSTGEFEESSYYDELENIQAETLSPLLDKHYQLVVKSEVEPKFGVSPKFSINWSPLKSMTDKEIAEVNEINSRTDANLFNMGAIDGVDIRNRIIEKEESGYNGLEAYEDEEEAEKELEKVSAVSRVDPRRNKSPVKFKENNNG